MPLEHQPVRHSAVINQHGLLSMVVFHSHGSNTTITTPQHTFPGALTDGTRGPS